MFQDVSILTVATSTMLLQMEEFGIKHQYAANTRLSKAMKLLRLLCLLKNASGLRSPPTHLTERDPLEHPVFGPRSQTRVSGCPQTPNCWVALQESAVFLQHEDVPRKFHVAHFRGCPTLFNKHTFEPDLLVKPIYVPADKAHCRGWAFEAVLSKARFRRIPRNGKSTFTIMSLHCQSTVAKRRSTA